MKNRSSVVCYVCWTSWLFTATWASSNALISLLLQHFVIYFVKAYGNLIENYLHRSDSFISRDCLLALTFNWELVRGNSTLHQLSGHLLKYLRSYYTCTNLLWLIFCFLFLPLHFICLPLISFLSEMFSIFSFSIIIWFTCDDLCPFLVIVFRTIEANF